MGPASTKSQVQKVNKQRLEKTLRIPCTRILPEADVFLVLGLLYVRLLNKVEFSKVFFHFGERQRNL